MNDQDSNMAANAICYAAQIVQSSLQEAAAFYTYPHVVYKPKLTRDGNQWCALLGDDLQVGVAGFGNSPADAMNAFDQEWYTSIKDTSPQAAAPEAP